MGVVSYCSHHDHFPPPPPSLYYRLTLFLTHTHFYLLGFQNSNLIHTRHEALYFSVVSVTTVGYGDEVCNTPLSKLFAVVYLMVGCLFTAAALADIAAFPIEMRRRANEIKVCSGFRRWGVVGWTLVVGCRLWLWCIFVLFQ